MSDLLPCPFCGSGQEHLFVDTSYHGFVVSCEECSGSASMRDWEVRARLDERQLAELRAVNGRLHRLFNAVEEALEFRDIGAAITIIAQARSPAAERLDHLKGPDQ